MKKYTSPELEVVKFETEDIMNISGGLTVDSLTAWEDGWFEVDAW